MYIASVNYNKWKEREQQGREVKEKKEVCWSIASHPTNVEERTHAHFSKWLNIMKEIVTCVAKPSVQPVAIKTSAAATSPGSLWRRQTLSPRARYAKWEPVLSHDL